MSVRTRVLIADDSAVIRKLLADALAADSSLELIRAARNGQEAVALCGELRPDLVLLDVEMPIMNGLEAVSAIRQFDRQVPIIMFSSLTARGAATTLEALARGASDFVVKPSRTQDVHESLAYVRRELVARIHTLRRLIPAKHERQTPRPAASSLARIADDVSAKAPADLVVIGASTGGPNALAELVRNLDSKLPAPVLITQHMPPVFTQLLAERLNGSTSLNVREAVDGAPIVKGDVWVAPGNFHMSVVRRGLELKIRLNQDSPVNSCRPAVDVLFQSAAVAVGNRCLAAVLTGMGRDGRDGALAIRKAGGRVLAQDEQTSVVYGMPRSVVEAGLAHQVLPIDAMGAAINAGCQAVRRATVNASA